MRRTLTRLHFLLLHRVLLLELLGLLSVALLQLLFLNLIGASRGRLLVFSVLLLLELLMVLILFCG